MRDKKGRAEESSGIAKVAWLAGLGIGLGIAAEKVIVGRNRVKKDPYKTEPYGKVLPDRSYEVSASDGAVLVVNEFGPPEATTGAIFLHGFCLDHTIWHHQMLSLDSGRRHLYFDARHHGRSRGGHEATSVKLLAGDLKKVIDSSGLEKIVLVGHSMGGMSVLEFCREHPDVLGGRVVGLVLTNTTYTDAAKTLFAAQIIGPVERRTRKVLNGILDSPRTSQLLRLRGDDLSYLIVRLFGFDSGASPTQIEYTRRLLAAFPTVPLIATLRGLREFDMEDALHKVDVPTLVIAGGDDRITSVKASEKIAAEIKKSRLVVFEDTGHMAMMERSEAFNPVLVEFLDSVLEVQRPKRRASKA